MQFNKPEKFCMYKERKLDNQLNDKDTISHDKIFGVIINMENRLSGYETCLSST